MAGREDDAPPPLCCLPREQHHPPTHQHTFAHIVSRCQGLNHGAPIPGVADLAVQAAEDGSRLVTPEELRNKIM